MYSASRQERQHDQCNESMQADETGRQSRTHLEELGVGDDDDDRDNVGGGGDDDDDNCGCDSDWQEAEVTLLPREETGVLRLL